MSTLRMSLRAALPTTGTVASLALLALAACGSDKSASSGTATNGNSTATSSIKNTSSSTKMARQSSDDVQEQADLSESASTGTSDDGGTKAPEQHGGGKGFDVTSSPSANFNNITADFNASLSFSGGRSGGASLHGDCGVKAHKVSDGNLSLTLTTNVTRVLDNNDVISVKTEPTVTITRSGSRIAGKVTRGITGTVHRTLTSATDATRNFDLTIQHDGSTVVDLYGPAPTFLLQTRTHNGTATVTDNLNNSSSKVTFNGVTRGAPGKCLCPTGGTITQVVTTGSSTETHTYDFSGACGSSTVSVDGSAAVSTTASATAKKGVEDSNTVASGNSNSTASTTASGTATIGTELHGSLTWEQCVPSGS